MMKRHYYRLGLAVLCLSAFAGCDASRGPKVAPCIADRVAWFAPDEVNLLPGPLLELQDQGRDYLLWLQPDSLLHFFRIEAGLTPKAQPYAGWESEDVWGVGPLRGGFMGYYLSGLSLMYRATGDERLLRRLEYTLSELEACRKAGGDGYIMAIADGRELFRRVTAGEIRTDNPTVNGAWAPLYLINKMLHGLRAAYVEAGQRQALTLMTSLADWFGYGVLDKLTDEQVQRLLVCEHGSINESYLDVYELTGELRYLEWAGRLNDRSMWVPLSEGKDILNGWHANTQIPKFTGFEKYYTHTGDVRFDRAARNFWEIVTTRHSWVIGGNSTGEHFFPESSFEEKILQQGGPETCNSVNMMRLTEALFAQRPEARMAEYYERVLLNHILSAYDPCKGMCVYFTPMRPAHYRVYGSEDHSFWCCNQSGLETPAKLNRMVFTKQGRDLMVNLFVPAAVTWKERDISLIQQASMPESPEVTLILQTGRERDLGLLVRKPSWSPEAVLTLNGRVIVPETDSAGYWVVREPWSGADTLTIGFHPRVTAEKLPGSERYSALLYGPYVLAGRMGTDSLPASFWRGIDNGANNVIPMPARTFVPWTAETIASHVVKTGDDPLTFGFDGEEFRDIEIEPFYRVHFERYTVYWPVR